MERSWYYTWLTLLSIAVLADVIFLIWGLKHYSWIWGDVSFSDSIVGTFWVLVIAFLVGSAIAGGFIGLAATGIIDASASVAIATYEAVKEISVALYNALIDLFTIKQTVRQKCPAALKAKILEKRKNAVNVGIFGKNNKITHKITISSDMGVSTDINPGEIIII